MFGIKNKVYNIFALIFSVSGITVLALNLFKVFGDNKETNMIFTLASIVSMLLAFALYLRPKSKLMQIVSKVESEYRASVYTLLTKDSMPNKLTVSKALLRETSDNHIKLVSQKNEKDELILDSLSFDEGLYIIIKLLEEFSNVMYAKIDENNKLEKYKKPVDANIESFEIELVYLNGEVKTRKLIDNFKYL